MTRHTRVSLEGEGEEFFLDILFYRMSEITIQHLSLAYEAGRSGQTEGAFSGVGLAGQGQSGFLTIIQSAAKPLEFWVSGVWRI